MESTFKYITENKIIPHLKRLMTDILRDQESLVIDGVEVFKSGDVFVPGKIVNGASYILTMSSDDEQAMWIKKMKQVIDFTASMPMKTWGYLNYLMGLYRLKEHGLLEQVICSESLEILKEALDWRHFVNLDDLSLISLPTNYYGVAYSVARYRELLGWETSEFSTTLFDKLFQHVKAYSGDYLFMDETAGEGRFDRYSILIPGEICSTLTSTGLEVPETAIKMLRQSADICIALSNKQGNGISYGRSIGAYGDTAILEILSIAAKLGILTKEEETIAYNYNVAIANKFTDFWIDSEMASINMWEKGRRTDGYRHKGRILGENFSLSCQLLHTYHQWKDAGYEDISAGGDWLDKTDILKPYQYYKFSESRGLLVVRDQEHVFSLPLINGGGGTSGDVHGKSYYYATPYLPIPNESRVLETPSDTFYAQLTPRLIMADGSQLMPIVNMKNIRMTNEQEGFALTYEQDSLCKVGERYPRKDESVFSNSRYIFKNACIEKEDCFYIKDHIEVKEIFMEFLTFSKGCHTSDWSVDFSDGPISRIEVEGMTLEACQPTSDEEIYNTSHEKLETKLTFRCINIPEARPIKISWKIFYK